MPIYAYRCAACGHAKDVLQKLSDPLLTTCPACGAESYAKQLSAAGRRCTRTHFRASRPDADHALNGDARGKALT